MAALHSIGMALTSTSNRSALEAVPTLLGLLAPSRHSVRWWCRIHGVWNKTWKGLCGHVG